MNKRSSKTRQTHKRSTLGYLANIGRILVRDLKRFGKAPAAIIVVVFLLVLPSLYTWFNVRGFWDPYDNTGNLRVCVVNEDEGAVDDLAGELDVGALVLEQLRENGRLGWVITDRADAMEQVSSGRAYAAFIIPATFSRDLAALVHGGQVQPLIEYYVNEKASPVAPKITDVGAMTLDTTINDAFVSTVSGVVTERFEASALSVQGDLERVQGNALAELTRASAGIEDARASLDGLSTAASTAMGRIGEAKPLLSSAKTQIDNVSEGLGETAALVEYLNTELVRFSLTAGTALDDASAELGQAIVKADFAIQETASGLSAAHGAVEAALSQGEAAAQAAYDAAAELRAAAEGAADEEQRAALYALADELEREAAAAEQAVEDLRTLSESVNALGEQMLAASEETSAQAKQAIGRADSYREQLSTQTIPAVSEGLAKISAAASALSASVAAQSVLIDQVGAVLDQLSQTLALSKNALAQTDGMLADLAGELRTVTADVAALRSADAIAHDLGLDNLDVSKIADFMMSPTVVKTEKFYALDNYGSAMAPLFMNLTLWIGVFMLMVIMRLEVDDEGVRDTTVTQRYIARGLLLSVMAALQAVICCTGCLILGVQCASVPVFFLTAIIASLAYLAIQYALSTTLQHVGKAFCIILVFVEIPGASGLYPIEMTPAFFQAVYPLFPFTYGIDAMREAICGFYENAWGANIAVLLGFLVAFDVFGSVARPYLANLNRLFAKQIEQSDIINIESTELPEHHYRISQMIKVLADREEYRQEMQQSTARFMQLYPRLKMWAIVAGIAVPAIATIVLAVSQATKAAMLALWLAWLVAIVLFLIGIEYMKDSLERRLSLDALSDTQVQALYTGRKHRQGDGGEAQQ